MGKDPVCEVCGGSDLVLSQVKFIAEYGSIHDGERLSLAVCGECHDVAYAALLSRAEQSPERERRGDL